ncbi:MAG: DinB family protein [bacterium]|nr:DinB family protein [bacterium]
MSGARRLAEEMRFSFDGDPATGENHFQPAVRLLLTDVDSKRALLRPLPDAHTIWELVLHLTTWKRYISARLRGETPEVTAEMDWQSVGDTNEAAWQHAVNDLFAAQDELLTLVRSVTESDLYQPARGGTLQRYSFLNGIMQHDNYHGGQIAILKKARLE